MSRIDYVEINTKQEIKVDDIESFIFLTDSQLIAQNEILRKINKMISFKHNEESEFRFLLILSFSQ